MAVPEQTYLLLAAAAPRAVQGPTPSAKFGWQMGQMDPQKRAEWRSSWKAGKLGGQYGAGGG